MLSIVLNNFYLLPYKVSIARKIGMIKILHGFIPAAAGVLHHASCEEATGILPE
ncbi:hypothetical protein EDF70_107136 [Neorhizobium sp. JUb45]|nr:hypothetical protein EDF70_107136 [Neorhizobium sp. JUb45]